MLIISRKEEGGLEFSTTSSDAASEFCAKKQSGAGSKCDEHYSQLFSKPESGKRSLFSCPYGLSSVGPINWTERPRIVSGFLPSDQQSTALPQEVARSALISNANLEKYLESFDQIAREYFDQSYAYLESAIHDVRHLNSAITSHAERLLKQLGYDMGQEWDLSNLNSSETGRKALSVYCASRDISSALSMHEIAIDPKRASDELVPHHLHKIFYKQLQISSEKIGEKKLATQLGNTSKIIQLTKSFSLIPMILINNAVKYSSSGSLIKLEFVEAGPFFRIICTNSGPVLRGDELPKAFKKHWRGSNRSGIPGHGIGLWLAKLIVEANLGTIEMSVNEKGRDIAARRVGDTTVTIRLLHSRSKVAE